MAAFCSVCAFVDWHLHSFFQKRWFIVIVYWCSTASNYAFAYNFPVESCHFATVFQKVNEGPYCVVQQNNEGLKRTIQKCHDESHVVSGL